jgi:YD repeat-containing protein
MQDTISLKYFYDGDKRLIKQKEYMHSYLIGKPVPMNLVYYQYDLNGVLTKKTESNSETSYRYDAEYKNTVQTEPFYFPVQQHLPTHTYVTRFGTTITIEHTYTYDDQKRLISEKAATSDGKITVKTYTYQ